MHQFLAITNIPTPYRNYFYQTLSGKLVGKNIAQTVFYMSETEKERFWDIKKMDNGFDYILGKSKQLPIKGINSHINLEILALIRKIRPDVVMMAGSWTDLTNIIALLYLKVTKLFRPQIKILFWAEFNFYAMKYSKGIVALCRKIFFSMIDVIVIPGRLAEETLKSSLCIKKEVYFLPNVVDEKRYRLGGMGTSIKESFKKAHSIPEEAKVFFLPARLNEEDKGIINFISKAGIKDKKDFFLLIAGDGKDKGLINNFLKQDGYENVILLGHIDQGRIADIYQIADCFLLPSLIDPNPLSVIEALIAGKPMLVSNRCGNVREALEEGINGWSFDPCDEASTRRALALALGTSKGKLEEMGKRSREIAELNFDSQHVTENFSRYLSDLIERDPK